MKHLGDITKISGFNAPVVDCVIGGNPCQDLSVAGKCAGLDGERSKLFYDQIRIIKEMREKDVRNNCNSGVAVRPRYMVWENVPGAFSSNRGEDFRTVLEETAKVADKDAVIPRPDGGKWSTSGCIMGNGWSIAWRVLDAQFWGVPQRRRRIALVADFGGQSAPEILFVRQSVCGDSEPGEPKRKTTAGNAGESSGGAIPCTLKIRGGREGGGKGALIQVNKSATVYDARGNGDGSIDPTITGDHENRVTDYTGIVIHGYSQAAYDKYTEDDNTATLKAKGGSYWEGSETLIINGVKGFPLGFRAENTKLYDDTATTLCNGTRPGWCNGVVQPKAVDCRIGVSEDGISNTINAKGPGAVCYGIGAYDSNAWKSSNPYSGIYETDISKTLDAFNCGYPGCNQGGIAVVEQCDSCAVDCRNGTENHDVNGTLQAKDGGGTSLNLNNVIRQNYTVRRLTPLECERLQGYPDGWTDIGEWTDSNGKKRHTSDSSRYKALGNSIAIPPWKWVLKRLCACYERDATMASLFDGIGGFPYIWEQINGRGTCLWASEIEEFPMAVTIRRFGDEV